MACLDWFHMWILNAYLLDHAGISPQRRTIIIVTNTPVNEQIGHWNVVKKQCKEFEYLALKITKLVIMSYDSICLMCCVSGILTIALSQLS